MIIKTVRHTSTTIIFSCLGLFFLTVTSVLAQDTENPASIPGRIQGTGAFFKITDSEYLNIFLQSSEEITVLLESVPKTISLIIEASSVSDSTILTFSNLEPSTTYYKLQDSYKNKVEFNSDENGKYTFTQDITQPHHIWFQPEDNGTVFLPQECTTYGIWDENTSTCTLNQDLTESVEVTTDNITLDCNNHKIEQVYGGYGIYLNYKSGVKIENCLINNFSYGIYYFVSPNTTLNHNSLDFNYYGSYNNSSNSSILTNNAASSNYLGIIISNSSSSVLDNSILSNNEYGIYLYGSGNSVLTNNKMFDNKYNFYLEGNSDSDFNLSIDTSNITDGKPIYYIKNASNQVYDNSTNAGAFFCIFCNNVTIKDLTLTKNAWGVFFWKTKDSKIENVNTLNNVIGIDLRFSDNNILTNNIANSNRYAGIRIWHSDSNTINVNTVNSNLNYGILLDYAHNNTLMNNNINSNSSRGIYLADSRDNIFDGNTPINNPYGIEIAYSDNNTVINSTISGAQFIDVLLSYGSANNEIYHNNFIGNATHLSAYWSGPNNLFDNGYPDGGNYYSNLSRLDLYSGPNQNQLGSDGIADTPYEFDGGRDKYPFMKESGWAAPPVPTYDVAVILAEPSDKSFEAGHDKAYFEGIIEQVKDYYCENAFGKWNEVAKTCDGGVFNLKFDIYDNNGVKYKLTKSKIDYGKNFSTRWIYVGTDGNNRKIMVKDKDNTEQFAWDTINIANQDINYNQYNMIIVVHPEKPEQDKTNIIEILEWSKRINTQYWDPEAFDSDDVDYLYPFPVMLDSSEYVKNWIVVSEFDLFGTFAHEIGHALGRELKNKPLCDLYEGALNCWYGGSIKEWDLMSRGNYLKNIDGFSNPSHLSSFSKIKLDWFGEELVGYDVHLIESLETMKFGEKVKRFNLVNNSYYLLEARTRDSQYSKWDTALPEDALVVYKVAPKEINGETIDFVNIAKIIDLQEIPYAHPLKDGVNDVLIGPVNYTATPSSFKVYTNITTCNFINYLGFVLKPGSSVLKEIWNFYGPLREDDYWKRYFATHPIVERSLLMIRINEFKEDVLKRYLYLIIVPLLMLMIVRVILELIPKLKKDISDKLRNKKRLLNILIIIFVTLLIIWLLALFSIFIANKYIVLEKNINSSRIALAAPLISSDEGVRLMNSDLDLHAYDNQGRHVGINYETGEYEDQIPGAETSGDLVYDDEWIFVPEGTNVRFIVSSKDIYEMLEQEPELKELTDGIEIYEVQAIHYDETSQRYESNVISQEIIPGIEQSYSVVGTHEQTQIERTITIPDIIEDVKISYDLGWITKKRVKNILIAKLKTAQKLQQQKEKQLKHFNKLIEKAKNPKAKQALEKAKEKYEEAMNKAIAKILKSFIKEIETYTKKGWITQQASEVLINDANYIIEHL